MTEEEHEWNNKEFDLCMVLNWVGDHKNLEGRFRFFKVMRPKSQFYQRIALPLLSMRTTVSIDVECAAKPYKNSIMTKLRN